MSPLPMASLLTIILGVGFETASPTRSATLSGYAQFYSRSHHAVIRVYDAAGDVIGTHEHAGKFKEP